MFGRFATSIRTMLYAALYYAKGIVFVGNAVVISFIQHARTYHVLNNINLCMRICIIENWNKRFPANANRVRIIGVRERRLENSEYGLAN